MHKYYSNREQYYENKVTYDRILPGCFIKGLSIIQYTLYCIQDNNCRKGRIEQTQNASHSSDLLAIYVSIVHISLEIEVYDNIRLCNISHEILFCLYQYSLVVFLKVWFWKFQFLSLNGDDHYGRQQTSWFSWKLNETSLLWNPLRTLSINGCTGCICYNN